MRRTGWLLHHRGKNKDRILFENQLKYGFSSFINHTLELEDYCGYSLAAPRVLASVHTGSSWRECHNGFKVRGKTANGGELLLPFFVTSSHEIQILDRYCVHGGVLRVHVILFVGPVWE